MTFILALLGTLGTLSLVSMVFILAQLSERFGSVIKMSPLYRGYYVAMLFLFMSWLTHAVVAGATMEPAQAPAMINQPWFLFVTYHLPLAIGVTISLVVTWLYWSWLVTER